MIYLASDHGGYNYKEKLKKHFEEKGIKFQDFGTNSIERCDAIDFVAPACFELVKNPKNKGIFICRSGQMVTIIANKFSGVRAVCCYSEKNAKSARLHSDANVLTTGGDEISFKKFLKIVNTFLGTEHLGGIYKKRIDKLKKLEKNLNENNK